MPAFKDLSGQCFNQLTVLSLCKERNAFGKFQWLCRCTCGKELMVHTGALTTGNTKSCGCRRVEKSTENGKANKKHGLTGCPEYKAWQSMKDRCYNKDNQNYHNYGERGIVVCERWLRSFWDFYKDMGKRPGSGYSLDRKDVNGNYEPDNCRWATAEEQSNNKRNNVVVDVLGFATTIAQLARELEIPTSTISARMRRGMSVEESITNIVKRSTRKSTLS